MSFEAYRYANAHYEGGETRKTYRAAILPSRAMMKSIPVYAGVSPFGPEPDAAIAGGHQKRRAFSA